MSAKAEPIGADEAAGLLAGLDRPFAIAVSGGADSMALMHLVAAWHSNGGGSDDRPPLVLTVDHGLRAASAEEAGFVATEARRLGFAHETLYWTGAKPKSGIQDAARRARYDLMLDRLALETQPRDLLLAHHLEDQAETLLMRLARGSGIDGLSGMRSIEARVAVLLGAPVRERVIRLRRPLLAIPKARLGATLQAMGASWREDPSNADVRFERVRLRRSQAALGELGLTPEGIARSARRLASERSALAERTGVLSSAHVADHGGVYGEFRLPGYRDWLPADVIRILGRLLDVFGGAAPPAQMSQVETLTERLLAPGSGTAGRLSLGGCLVNIVGAGPEARVVTVCREPSRHALPVVTLQPGEGVFWDRRFYISVAVEAQSAVRIEPFAGAIGDEWRCAGPRDALLGLPAVVSDDARLPLVLCPRPTILCEWPMQHVDSLAWRAPSGAAKETI